MPSGTVMVKSVSHPASYRSSAWKWIAAYWSGACFQSISDPVQREPRTPRVGKFTSIPGHVPAIRSVSIPTAKSQAAIVSPPGPSSQGASIRPSKRPPAGSAATSNTPPWGSGATPAASPLSTTPQLVCSARCVRCTAPASNRASSSYQHRSSIGAATAHTTAPSISTKAPSAATRSTMPPSASTGCVAANRPGCTRTRTAPPSTTAGTASTTPYDPGVTGCERDGYTPANALATASNFIPGRPGSGRRG